MKMQIRVAVAALAAALVAAPCLAAEKERKASQPVAGENQYRSASGYHTAVMEHCRELSTLAKGKGEFNVALAREQASEVARNLEAAGKHMAGYLGALTDEQKGMVAEQSAVASAKQGESARLAARLGEALGGPNPDRSVVAATVRDLYLSERDLLAAHKVAGKTLGIRAASAPQGTRPPGSRPKRSKASADGVASASAGTRSPRVTNRASKSASKSTAGAVAGSKPANR